MTNDPYNSYTELRRNVAACGDTVHVAWCDDSMEKLTIHYVRSMDAGLNWDTEIQQTDGEYNSENVTIAASGNYVHLVYKHYTTFSSPDDTLIYIRSTNGGVDWESEVHLTGSGGIKWHPSIDLSGNFVHVTWYGKIQDEWQVSYVRSEDYGTTWGDPVQMTFNPDMSIASTLAAAASVVHLVWHDWRHGDPEIYYKRSADNGTTWGDDIRLTDCAGQSRMPEIDCNGDFVQIVFQDSRGGDYEIYSMTSLDGGLSWGPEVRLTFESSGSELPFVSIVGSESHIVWEDLRAGIWQVYYMVGHNFGSTWDEVERLTNTVYDAKRPSLAFSGDWLHVVWYDERDGNTEIYCKNKYVENPIGINEESLDAEGMEWSIYPNPASSQFAIAPTPSLPQLGEGEREGANNNSLTI